MDNLVNVFFQMALFVIGYNGKLMLQEVHRFIVNLDPTIFANVGVIVIAFAIIVTTEFIRNRHRG